jgi:hypothetical protein
VILVIAGLLLSQTLNTAVQTGDFATSPVEPRPDAFVPISDLSASERAVMDTLLKRNRVPTATVSFQIVRTEVLTASRIGKTVFFGWPESQLPDTMYVRADGVTYRTTFVGSVDSTRLPRVLVSGICFLAALVLWRRGDEMIDRSTGE